MQPGTYEVILEDQQCRKFSYHKKNRIHQSCDTISLVVDFTASKNNCIAGVRPLRSLIKQPAFSFQLELDLFTRRQERPSPSTEQPYLPSNSVYMALYGEARYRQSCIQWREGCGKDDHHLSILQRSLLVSGAVNTAHLCRRRNPVRG